MDGKNVRMNAPKSNFFLGNDKVHRTSTPLILDPELEAKP